MAKRINFKSDVSSELRAYLQKEYNEYTAKTSMTEDEHKALRKWIEEGNSSAALKWTLSPVGEQ